MNNILNLTLIKVLQEDWSNEVLFQQELNLAFDKLELELFYNQSTDFMSSYKTLRFMEYELLNSQNDLRKGLKKTGLYGLLSKCIR